MVRKSRARSSSLFLMELILAILFFSVASAVCVQFFVRSHLLSRDSDALNHAVSECSGIAELVGTVESAADAVALIEELYPDCVVTTTDDDDDGDTADTGTNTLTDAESVIDIYYNDAFETCREDQAAYLLTIQLTEAEQMLDASMQVTSYWPADNSVDRGIATVYELNIQHHIARHTGK